MLVPWTVYIYTVKYILYIYIYISNVPTPKPSSCWRPIAEALLPGYFSRCVTPEGFPHPNEDVGYIGVSKNTLRFGGDSTPLAHHLTFGG